MTYTVAQLPDGKFDLQDEHGNSVMDRFGGPVRDREFVESIQRMIGNFDAIDAGIFEAIQRLRRGN
jgi:hypothetical protein